MLKKLRRFFCIFVGWKPPKMLGEHPSGFSPNPFPQGGKLLFPHNKADFCVSKKRKEENEVFLKPFALANAFLSLRSSASGGLKPFSEEKGFKNSKKTFFASRARLQLCNKFTPKHKNRTAETARKFYNL